MHSALHCKISVSRQYLYRLLARKLGAAAALLVLFFYGIPAAAAPGDVAIRPFAQIAQAKKSTTTTLTTSRNPGMEGKRLVLRAKVKGDQPTGSVTFKNGEAVVLGTGVVRHGVATLEVSDLPVGQHFLSAIYSGDEKNAPSFHLSRSQSIQPAPGQRKTTVLLSSSSNPSMPGRSITLLVRVAGNNPTGTVHFQDGPTLLGRSALIAGEAKLLTNTLLPGKHSVVAVYSGDKRHKPGRSEVLLQSVDYTASSTTLRSSANPADAEQTLRLTSTIAGNAPSGSVTFKHAELTLGTSTIVNGVASLAVRNLIPGKYYFSASYSGDALNSASTSNVLVQTIQAGKTATTLRLVSTNNPSKEGQPITLVAWLIGNKPTGQVVFKKGSAVLGSAPLELGVTTFDVVNLAEGTHGITAVYSGDAYNQSSTSAPLLQSVQAKRTISSRTPN